MQDVGQSVLECYSRVLESLAHTIMSRIEDILYADSLTQNPSLPGLNRPAEGIEKLNAMEAPAPMTLLDFMGWSLDQETETIKEDMCNLDDTLN